MSSTEFIQIRSTVRARYRDYLVNSSTDDSIPLDSSFKKVTSFIKKLRSVNQDQVSKIIQELKSLKFEKYFDEILSSLMENSFSSKQEIIPFISVLVEIFLKYPEFTSCFLAHITSQLKPVLLEKEQMHIANLLKQCSIFQVYTELYLIGVEGTSHKFLQSTLLSFMNASRTNPNHFIAFISQWIKNYGADLFEPNLQLSDPFLPVFILQELKQILQTYFNSSCVILLAGHKKLREMQHSIIECSFNMGKVPDELNVSLVKAQNSISKLTEHLNVFVEYLNFQLPSIPNEPFDSFKNSQNSLTFISNGQKIRDFSTIEWYEQEEDAILYANIPDISSLVLQNETDDSAELSCNIICNSDENIDEKFVEVAVKDCNEIDTVKENDKNLFAADFRLFSIALLNLSSAEAANKLATEYCSSQTKRKGKRLLLLLEGIPRSFTGIIPYVARFLKIINQKSQNVSNSLVASLMGKFRFLTMNSHVLIESRRKVAVFICELSKFQVFPINLAYWCLKRLIVDRFIDYNVDMSCYLLEGMGKFLRCQPETAERMDYLIDVMKNKRMRCQLNSRQIIMIDNTLTYLTLRPSDSSLALRVKVRPPQLEFLREFIYGRVNSNNLSDFTCLLRDYFDWNDSVMVNYLMKKLSKCWKFSFDTFPIIANLLLVIREFHVHFCFKIIDSLLEEVRVGLENNYFQNNHKRIALSKFIGLLFKQKIINFEVILETLWTILSFGYSKEKLDFSQENLYDPRLDTFRICVIAHLLQSSFGNSSFSELCHENQIKLWIFIVYFNIYLFSKPLIGIEINDLLSDCFSTMGIPAERMNSFSEAQYALNELNHNRNFYKEYYEKHYHLIKEIRKEELQRKSQSPSRSDCSEPKSSLTMEQLDIEENISRSDDELEIFDLEFNNLVNASISENKLLFENGKRKSADLPVPVLSKGASPVNSSLSPNQVAVTFLAKKYNSKSQAKKLSIPSLDPIAVSVTKSIANEMKQKQLLNKIVLREVNRQNRDEGKDN